MVSRMLERLISMQEVNIRFYGATPWLNSISASCATPTVVLCFKVTDTYQIVLNSVVNQTYVLKKKREGVN